ncbi:two-component system OmpR family sensor kinase/two-component system sensor histidine kinase QseC [Kaistia hirudinis]|uniref:histidine kinase n=1 Tax=Kaistia hirudinis TaxID=1293440 RepID=A0A840AT58_9HYPH|nr:ATP-binding protein [Kaistia hirudinis]MBB3932433.1 two-component system OmpR family sensor kinase/two-component system sensor histidine kinase QseC [Kaistia hirudinis]
MSLRRRAFLWVAALMTLVGLATAAIGYFLVSKEASEFLDDQIRQIAFYVGDTPAVAAFATAPSNDPEDDLLVQVWDEAGHPLRLSAVGTGVERQLQTGFADVETPDGGWRVYSLVTPDRTVQVSQRLRVREEIAAGSAWRAALPVVALIPMAWLMLTFVVTRMMRRLNVTAGAVGARAADDVDPIPTDHVPAEVLPFVHAINRLLSRLAGVLERQRRFVSDAAHELRTPLAALRIQIDNLQNANRSPELTGLLADMDGGIRRSSNLVSQLLKLARYDETPEPDRAVRVDLVAVTLSILAEFAPLAERKSIDLGVVRQDEAFCVGLADDFAVIIGNFVDNAIRYTSAQGAIDVAIRRDGAGIVVEVIDTGPGIAPEDLPRVFERFFRSADPSGEGSGLGLAIAKAAAERNGAVLHIANRTDRGGLVCALSVPAA